MPTRHFEIDDNLKVVPSASQIEKNGAAVSKIVWIDVEAPDPAELRQLLKRHGIEDWMADRVLDFEARHEFYETAQAVYFGFPVPASWQSRDLTAISIILVKDALITVRDFSFDGFDRWLHPRNSERKVQSWTVPGLLHWFLVALLSGDAERFFILRETTEIADREMQEEGHEFDHRKLEEVTAEANRLLNVTYDAHVIAQAIPTRSRHIFDFDEHRALYEKGAENLRILREGIDMLLRRLEFIKQQHSMNLQRQTDHRIRLLTIFSVLFMPPTLITGIYGMNLQNIPGLHSPTAYLIVFGIMSGIAIWMLFLFLKRGWFS
jgi:magnesium transporter